MLSLNENSIAHKKYSVIWSFLKGCKLFFLLGMLSTSAAALADMVIPQIIKIAVDNIIGGRPLESPLFVKTLVGYLGGAAFLRAHMEIMASAVIAVALVKMVFSYASRVYGTKATETLVKTARDSLFSHIESLPYSWHMKNPTGDIIQRCTSDIETVKEFISFRLTQLFRIIILLVLSLIFMFGMNVRLAAVAFIPVPFIIINSFIFDSKIEKGFEEFDREEARLSSMLHENLTGVQVVRAFGQEIREKEAFGRRNAYYTKIGENLGRSMGLFWGLSDTLTGIQMILVIMFGALFCIKGSMTPGGFIAFLSYNTLLSWPLNQLGKIIAEFGKASISAGRITYIMQSEPEKDVPGAVEPDLNRDIAFEHVSFSYGNSPAVLKDVSFSVKAGTTVGILGGTGSGKSTLMLLLDKLYPLPDGCGRITIGGVDIKEINTQYLRGNIGIVLQDPFLFSGTIGENIGITDENMGAAGIRQAAADACLDETITSFSKGYDTFIGERGVTLSGGQRQRTAIARVLAKKTPILIFDDSMSAVDTYTDAKIRASLEAKFGSASIFIISHRTTSLSKADKIIVLEHGKIAEQGTHRELIEKNGIYRKIYDIQTGNEVFGR